MQIASLLNIGHGVTALIGGGGKTTLMYTLAEELRPQGSVILCTSTKIRVPEQYTVITGDDPGAVMDALSCFGAVCVGAPYGTEKLQASPLSFSELARLADYVIAEADGAHGLPLKAHAPHEPVIPENAAQVILVAGVDGIGRPIRAACHRPELYAQLAHAAQDDIVTPETAAAVIEAEGLGGRVFINKAEDAEGWTAARAMARRLTRPVAAGSLRGRDYRCLF